jgi:DNA-binding GntR family transcriptional regulator
MSIFQEQLPSITKKDRVADLIKRAILSGKLQPGDRIVELKIAKELNTGTTSVREALFELERQGFVTRINNKGAYVTQLTTDDTRQIYRLRTELEGLAVQLLTEQIDQVDIEALENIIAEMKRLARDNNLIQFYEVDLHFHKTLWRLSKNQYLIECLERLVVPLFAFYIMRTSANSDKLISGAEHHEKILSAIKTGNPDEARRVTEDELKYFSAIERDLFDSYNAPTDIPLLTQ